LMLTSPASANFGIVGFDGSITNQDGSPDTQAGSHPYAFTTSITLSSLTNSFGQKAPDGNVKDIVVKEPAGLVGNPTVIPTCTDTQLSQLGNGWGSCPVGAQIGQLTAQTLNAGELTVPLYNMVPSPGEPARFGASLLGPLVYIDTHVRSGGDYGLTASLSEATTLEPFWASTVTLWGVPADPSHDAMRGAGCVGDPTLPGDCFLGGLSANASPRPFLTLPTSCAGPQEVGLSTDSWQNQGEFLNASFLTHDAAGNPVGLEGCNRLSFAPSITVQPDTSVADSPAGLTVNVKVPQEGLLAPEGLASADIKDTTVVLPQGVAINPGQAAGLQACQASEDGLTTEAEKAAGEEDSGPADCPNASKVGEDEIQTPLLAHALVGDIYVLQSNPPDLKLLVTAYGEGVDVKLVGDVYLDEATGQLTTTFTETPELPFTNFRLSFSGGAQAALTTPAACGTYSANADFTPWASPAIPDALKFSDFAISSGPGGSACASPLPFSPTLTAGATTDQAGGYTDFSLLLQRADDQQRVSTLQFKTPEGLLGMISKVPLCAEADANAGTCPAASQIGHTVVTDGPGPYPLVVPQPGQPPAPIYLTGGYGGAPYGLSIVVPLVVGPFTLQTQVVRARIEVDPHTAQLTITTNPLPSIIDGIPTDLRTINAVIDRPGFMFNPTNCSPQAFAGTATSTEGATAPISSHFQVGSCQSLKFAPDFKVSTSAKTSRVNGASLDAKILYPTAPPESNQASSQANIASVKVELPKQLPSRLTTLQQACAAAQFEKNPAGCPAGSLVGHATALTPVLPVALTGPAYFVSHGGEAFPSLIVVLQGYGVTVDLVGTTFISKAGITSSTFKQVPDVPIASFELVLPEGRFSALSANASLCAHTLAMPTEFVAQNGAVIHESTPISVSGCKPAIKVTHKRIGRGAVIVSVRVPAAGRLLATAKGLSSGSGKASRAGTITVKMALTKAAASVLAKHRGHKLRTRVSLRFTPTHGAKLKTNVTVLIT
jgi:hypothetical protein